MVKETLICEIGNNHLGNPQYFFKYIDEIISNEITDVTIQIREEEFYKKNKKLLLSSENFIKGITKLKKKNIKVGYAIADKFYTKYLNNLEPDFFKILSWSASDIKLINFLIKKQKPIYISLGMLSEKKINNLYKKIYKKYDKFYFIHTQLNYKIRDLNLNFINKLKKITNFPICYGHHCKDSYLPLYMSQALDVKIIFIYIKIKKNQIHPDEDHAVYLSDVNDLKKEISKCNEFLGLERKLSSNNYIEKLAKERLE